MLARHQILTPFAVIRMCKIPSLRNGFDCKLFFCDGIFCGTNSVRYHLFLTNRKLLEL